MNSHGRSMYADDRRRIFEQVACGTQPTGDLIKPWWYHKCEYFAITTYLEADLVPLIQASLLTCFHLLMRRHSNSLTSQVHTPSALLLPLLHPCSALHLISRELQTTPCAEEATYLKRNGHDDWQMSYSSRKDWWLCTLTGARGANKSDSGWLQSPVILASSSFRLYRMQIIEPIAGHSSDQQHATLAEI